MSKGKGKGKSEIPETKRKREKEKGNAKAKREKGKERGKYQKQKRKGKGKRKYQTEKGRKREGKLTFSFPILQEKEFPLISGVGSGVSWPLGHSNMIHTQDPWLVDKIFSTREKRLMSKRRKVRSVKKKS